MVALWMLYATVVGFFVMAAAAALEALQQTRGGARWVWATSFVLALTVPFLRGPLVSWADGLLAGTWSSGESALAELGGMEIIGAPAVAAALAPWDTVLLLGWVAATTALSAVLALGLLKVRRAKARWRVEELDGVSVLVSDTVGPAVVGLLHAQIVIPAWALSLPHGERSLILRHESEHRLAKDPALLSAALAAALMMPWNAALWWGFHRLRHAVETDCDHRVLSTQALAASSYARLLLEVGTRPESRIPLGAGFGAQPSLLERRIRALVVKPTGGLQTTAGHILLAALLLAASCSVSNPDSVLPTDVQLSEVGAVQLVEPMEPSFTPFTVAPSIRNREEVVQAMVDAYPPLLKAAGIGGTVVVYFFIDELGRVQDFRIETSSGHAALDDAALRTASAYRFTPALNRDTPTAVWVQFPITFQAN